MSKVKKSHVPTVAAEIAELIASVDTDDRLQLFRSIEEELCRCSQYFTARCFRATQVLYAGVENTDDARG